MSWQSKMNILSHVRGQVNHLPAIQLLLKDKRLRQFAFKLVQASHAGQSDAKVELAGGKEPAAGNADVQRILERRFRTRPDLLEPQRHWILGTLQVKRAALRNLAQMNLHRATLIVNVVTFNGQLRAFQGRRRISSTPSNTAGTTRPSGAREGFLSGTNRHTA